MTKEDLEVTVSHTPTPTIKLRGEVDYHNAQRIRDAVAAILRKDKHSLVIDAGHLEFIDSSGLSALLDAAKAANARGGEVRLLSPGAQLMHVLTISGFAPYFSISPKDGAPAVPKPPVAHPSPRMTWQVRQFQFPPRTELISEIRNKVAQFAEALPFSRQDVEDIKLAVGEASSNALRYGCPNTSDSILVRCAHDGRSLRVQIEDSGPCFDPDEVVPPPVDALDEGGRGIFFMRVLMDEVKFFFTKSGTTVELIKNVV
ncbi:MAG: anti-sigma factor antagonist [Armatimonadota bacterium]|nr:anti-sigma factor antagonist [Armatimonadota bacterium]